MLLSSITVRKTIPVPLLDKTFRNIFQEALIKCL